MARTASLPGMSYHDEALTKLAERYVSKRDSRLAFLAEEVAFKTQVIAKMQELKLTEYYDEEANLTITLRNEVKVKVKIGSEGDDGDSD